MNHIHKLPSFKHLIKNFWHFYKANWKALIRVLLPIELALSVLAFIVIFGFTPARFSWIVFLGGIFVLLISFVQIFKNLLVFSGGIIISDIESKKSVKAIYKGILAQAMPIIWVVVLQFLYMSAIVIAVAVATMILFFLPFLILGVIARFFPIAMFFVNDNGDTITMIMLVISSVVFIATNIYFMLRVWFSSYTLLIDGRDGIDALANSAMLVRERGMQIFWRMAVITIIALLPTIIILGPVYIKILMEALPKMALVFALGLEPVFPPIAPDLIIWRNLLTILANLIWVPIFIGLNYFLWKDVKATAPVFEEAVYTKTRKQIKICVWAGLVFVVVFVCGSILSS